MREFFALLLFDVVSLILTFVCNVTVWRSLNFLFHLQCSPRSSKLSCEIVALRENFAARPESYDSVSAKSSIFLAHEKTRTVWDIFLHFHTQPDPKLGIKIFLRHFPTILVPSLTLKISDIVQSIFQSPRLEFSLIICHIRDLMFGHVAREVKLCKVSDGMRVVGKCLIIILIPCFWLGCVWEWRYIPQIVGKKYTTFSIDRIVALRSVNKLFQESYDFAATNLEV
jgi:hypothetical protein